MSSDSRAADLASASLNPGLIVTVPLARQDLLLGTDCCLDVAAGLAAGPGTTWGKRCCDNPRGPVTQVNINLFRCLYRILSTSWAW